MQVTAATLTPEDRLKVIDQGADETTNAVSIRKFFEKTAQVDTTGDTARATLIQSPPARHEWRGARRLFFA